MDWFDRRILEHVIVCAPYGGVPEDDVLPRFGLTVDQFRGRVAAIVGEASATLLTVTDRALLLRVRARLRFGRAIFRSGAPPR